MGWIAITVFFFGLFVYTVIFGLEKELTESQITQTQVAVEAMREARR